MQVGQLEIQLLSDMARLRKDMQDAKNAVGGAMESIEKAVGGAVTALGALGVGLSAGALLNWAKGALDAAGALHDLSMATGASVESLSAFEEIGRTTGTTAADIGGMIGKMAKNLELADEEGKGAALAIKALGIDFDAFQKLTPDQKFMAIAKAMDEYESSTGLSAAAQAIFGKGAAEAIPYMRDLAQATKLNAVVTAEQAAMADELADTLTLMAAQVTNAGKSFLLDLLPTIMKLGPLLESAAKILGAYLVLFHGIPALMALAVTGFNAFAVAVVNGTTVLNVFNGSLAATVAGTKAAVLQFGLLKSAAALALAGFAGWEIGTWLRENFLEAQLAGIAFVEGTMVAWEKMKLGVNAVWVIIKSAASTAFAAIGAGFASMLETVGKGLQTIGADSAATAVLGFAEKIRTASESATTLATEMAALDAEHQRAISTIKAITGDMVDEAAAAFKAGQAAKEAKKHLDMAGVLKKNKEEQQAETKAKKDAEEAAKRAAAAAAKEAEEYRKVIESITDKTSAYRLELQESEKLSDGQKLALKILEDVRTGNLKLTSAKAELLGKVLEEMLALEKSRDAMVVLNKATADAHEAHLKFIGTLEDGVDKLRDQVAEQERANARIGLGKEAVAALDRAQLEQQATVLEGLAIKALDKNLDEATYNLYKAQAEQLRELARLKEEGAAKETLVEVIKQAEEASKKLNDSIYDGLVDSLYRAFEAGNGFFSTLWAGIKNTLKTTVLRVGIEGVVKGIGGALGLGGPASALAGGSGGGGVMDVIGAGADLLGLGGIAGSLGTFGTGIMSGLTAWGSGGSVLGLLGSGSSLFAGGLMSGLGTIAGALGPIALGVMALSSLFDSKGGPKLEGGFATGMFSTRGGAEDAVAASIGQSIQQQYAQMATALGGVNQAIDALVFFAKDPAGDSLTQLQIAAGLNGQTVYGSGSDQKQLFENVGRSDEELQAAVALQSARAVFAALQASNLGPDVVEYLQQFDALTMSAEQIQAVTSTAAAVRELTDQLEPLGGVFGRLGELSINARAQLFDFAGGIEAFLQKTQAYVQAYYTKEEQLAISARGILQQLGDVGINAAGAVAKSQLRDVLDSLSGQTEGERRQIAALLNVAAEYATVADYLTEQGKTLGELAAAAPSLGGLAALQDPSARTAEATQATASGVAEVAENTGEASTRLQAVETNTGALITQNSAGFGQMIGLLEQLTTTMTEMRDDIRRLIAAPSQPQS